MTGRRAASIALLLLAFLLGTLVGIAAERTRLHRGVPESGLVLRMPDVLDHLDLTAQQRRAVDSILNGSNPRSEAVMREMVPRLAAIADSVRTSLRSVLTPAQAARMDSLTGRAALILKLKTADGRTRTDTVLRR